MGRRTWVLYSPREEVVVVHPDGAVSGPPADVAIEVGRLAAVEDLAPLWRQANTCPRTWSTTSLPVARRSWASTSRPARY